MSLTITNLNNKSMEYLIIIALQLIGCGLHVCQKVFELDKKFEDDTLSDVFRTFLRTDRVTLIISFLVLMLNLLAHFIIEVYAPQLRQIENWVLYGFALAFILGYAGQRLIYKYLGRAEEVLNKKVETKLQ